MRAEIVGLMSLLLVGGCSFELTPEGRAGCETTVTSVSEGSATMLPGAVCGTCHHRFTAAGTVFTTVDSACDTGHAADVRVEILDSAGNTAITLTTNEAGNFYTNAALPSPYTARITAPDGTIQQMRTAQTDGRCAECHREPPTEHALGRIAVVVPPTDGGVPDAH